MSEIRSILPASGDTSQITVRAHDGAWNSPYGIDYILVTYPFKCLGEVAVDFIYYVGNTGKGTQAICAVPGAAAEAFYTQVSNYHQDSVQTGRSNMYFRLLCRSEGASAALFTPTSIPFIDAPGTSGIAGTIKLDTLLQGARQSVHNIVCADTSYPTGGVDFEIVRNSTNTVLYCTKGRIEHGYHPSDSANLIPGETYTIRFWNPQFYDGTEGNLPSIAVNSVREINGITGFYDTVHFKPNPYQPVNDDYYLRCSSGTEYGIPEDIHVKVSNTPQGTNNSITFTIPKNVSPSAPITIVAGPTIVDSLSSQYAAPWTVTVPVYNIQVTITDPMQATVASKGSVGKITDGGKTLTIERGANRTSIEVTVTKGGKPVANTPINIQFSKAGYSFKIENDPPLQTDSNGKIILLLSVLAKNHQTGDVGAMTISAIDPSTQSSVPVYTFDHIFIERGP